MITTIVKQHWHRLLFFVLAATLGLIQPLKVGAQNQILIIPDVSIYTECNVNIRLGYFAYGLVGLQINPLKEKWIDPSDYQKTAGFLLRIDFLNSKDEAGFFDQVGGTHSLRETLTLSGESGLISIGGGDDPTALQCPYTADIYINALIPFSKPESSESGNICSSTTVTLSSQEIVESVSSATENGITAKWLYRVGSSSPWVDMTGYASSPQFSDSRTKTSVTFSMDQLGGVAGSTNVGFMVQASVGGHTVSSEILELSFIPSAPTLSAAGISVEPSCSGTATGKITLPSITSSGSVRYVLRNLANGVPLDCDPSDDGAGCLYDDEKSGPMPGNRILDSIPPGSYMLVIANAGGGAGGCYSTYNITVPEISPLKLRAGDPIQATAVSCFGQADGTVSLHFESGRLPITLGGGLPVSAHNSHTVTLAGLAAGTYSGTATDDCGAQVPLSFTIASPHATPTLSALAYHPTCNSPGNGSVRIAVVKAVGQNVTLEGYKDGTPFTPTTEQDGAEVVVGNLAAGSYRLVVYDTNHPGCGYSDTTVTLGAATALALSYHNVLHNACFGDALGQLVLSGSGAASYRYSLDGVGWSSNPSFTALAASTYTARVRRGIDGCLDEATTPVTITQPPQLAHSATVTGITCHNSEGGSIDATASGGLAPYTFVLVDETLFELEQTPLGSSYTFGSLPEGSYQVYVKDSNGCSSPLSMHTLTRPTALLFTAAAIGNPVCHGDAGSITPSGSGGTAPYTFRYKRATDSDIPASWSSFITSTPIPAGAYHLKVVDANGCETGYGSVVELSQPSEPLSFSLTLLDYSGMQVSCHGLSDGGITIGAQGGQAPYTYSLDGVSYQPAAYFGTLAAGSYTVYVEDALGCTRSTTTNLQEAAAPVSLTVAAVGNVDCGEAIDGYIQLSASGGHTAQSGAYRFRMEPSGEWQATGTFGGLSAGPYTFSVADDNGCSATAGATVISTSSLQVSVASFLGAQCAEQPDGQITLSASGGSGAYQFSMDGGSWQTSPLFSNLAPGEHVGKVRDAGGCTSFTLQTLPRLSSLSLSLVSLSHTTCPLNHDAVVTLQASGGLGGYQYRCATTGGSWGSDAGFTGLEVGDYVFEVRDSGGCTASLTVTVATQSTLTLAAAAVQQLACPESSIGVVELTAAGSSGYSYQMNGGDWQVASRFEGLGAGVYTFSVRDVNGCMATAGESVGVSLPPLAVASATAQDALCYGGSSGAITLAATGGTAPYSYRLQDAPQSSGTFSALPAGVYAVTVSDAGGCSVVHTVTVGQPERAVSAVVQVRPVCPGYTTGELTVYAEGGTAPYSYAVDGNPFSFPVIGGLSLGAHAVTVIDTNGCSLTQQVEVGRNEVSPNVSFLVSSKQDALDTLVLKEVSMPVPDSVRWDFDPMATVVQLGEAPVIAFGSPASYWVKLTAYYGGCDFTSEKTIAIRAHDPNNPSVPDYNQGFESFIAFPNPSDGVFTVQAKLKTAQTLQLQLYDMNGKLYLNKAVENALSYQELLAIPGLSPGTYFLRGATQNEARTFKLVVL